MLPSLGALTWRDHYAHYVQVRELAYTFFFLTGWLGSEVFIISVPLSFAVTAWERRAAMLR